MDLSIVIPCFNESESIPSLAGELVPVLEQLAAQASAFRPAGPVVEVIFVDDGSQDGTLAALQQAFGGCAPEGVIFCFEQHPSNRGLGAALRTGFAAASGDVVITTDSDGTYRYAEIPSLLAYLTPGVDIVTASPYHPEGGIVGVPAYREALSRGSSLIYRWLVDGSVHTYTALFRAYRRAVIKGVAFDADGFLGGTELLVKALLRGFRAAEYPTVLHSRAHGVSKAKILRTILAHVGFQRRVLMFRLHVKPYAAEMRTIGR